jgi:hypothetical protein
MNIIKYIMVVLGCHMYDIQIDRIYTAFNYSVTNLDKNNTYWFLTGGIKYATPNLRGTNTCSVDTNSEARQMLSLLNYSSNVVIDTDATNTAENFVNLKKWLEFKKFNSSQIIVTTSRFHKIRAEKLFNGIFNNTITPIWNLGNETCTSCDFDEAVHMFNVDNDVKKALNL